MKRIIPVFIFFISLIEFVQAEKFWVFFTDKTENNFIELDEKTIQRRQKMNIGSTWFDRYVSQEYINIIKEFGVIHRTSRWMNAVSVTLNEAQLSDVSDLHFVKKVEPVKTYIKRSLGVVEQYGSKIESNPRTLDYGYSQDQIEQINCHTAHDAGHTGDGVRILILDTGYNLERIVFDSLTIIDEWDFINNDGNTSNETVDEESYGQHNHGTYVFSTLAGYDPGNLIGPAFNSEFLLAKTENVATETQVEEDSYVAALEWGEQNGADVMSSSLGYLDWYSYCDMDGNTAVTTIAVDIAVSLGMVCVTSAGNWGSGDPPQDPCDTLHYYISAPADADSVISVGAVNSDGDIAYFSSHGPTYDDRIKPEVCARGVSTWCVNANSDSYRTASGTSLSAPLVSGAAAVILSAHPDWTPMEVREAMLETADRSSDPDNEYGYGVIDVMAAIDYEPTSSVIEELPNEFSLLNVYPNPFNSTTTIQFTIERQLIANLRIYDLTGRLVETLINEKLEQGSYVYEWNASHHSSGIYFVSLHTDKTQKFQKITYLK